MLEPAATRPPVWLFWRPWYGRLLREKRMRLPLIWTAALAGLLLLPTLPATAQPMTREEIELRDQVYQLQQQMQSLQAQIAQQRGSGGSYLAPPAGYPPSQSGNAGELVPQLLTEVQTLQGEVRDLRGRVDELQNQLSQQVADLGKRIDDLSFRINQAGGAPGATGEEAPPAGPAPQGTPGTAQGFPQGVAQPQQLLSPPPAPLGMTRAAPPPAQPAAPQPPEHLTPEQAIARGRAALARHDYSVAEAAARDVLNNHRTSPRAYEAHYILAEALAGQHRYRQSAIAYDDTYNSNRKGALAPEALVGLARSLAAINEKPAACITLAKLHTEFPQLHPGVRDAAAALRQRAGCK